jgi:Uma2 family endonuclease
MTASPRLKEQDRFSYSDYLTWPDDERWELINGVAYDMSPAPGRRHQEISIALASQFYTYLKGKLCKVYDAPFDVRLVETVDEHDNVTCTVVQPDIVVICDSSKLDNRGCKGAPDIVVEIVSPSTGSYDLTTKFDMYQRHSVKEYWIVLPEEQTVMVFKLQQNGMFGSPDRFGGTDRIAVTMLGELIIDLADVFAE